MARTPDQLRLEMEMFQHQQAQQPQAPAPVDPYEGGQLDAAGEGFGAGLKNSVLNLTDLFAGAVPETATARLKTQFPEFEKSQMVDATKGLSDQAMQDIQDELAPARSAFPKTTAVSEFAGEIAPHLASGNIVYGAGRGLVSGPLKSRVLGGATEGAYQGFVADNDNRGANTATGATIGTAFPLVTKTLSKGGAAAGEIAAQVGELALRGVGKLSGLKKNKGAEFLGDHNISGVDDIPLSQSLDEGGVVHMLYNQLIGSTPKAGAKLRTQRDVAEQNYLTGFLNKLVPERLQGGETVEGTIPQVYDKVSKLWEKSFEPFNQLIFNNAGRSIPKDATTSKIIASKAPDLYKKWIKGDELTGADITTVRTVLNEAKTEFLDKPGRNNIKLAAVNNLLKGIDDVIDIQFKPGTKLGNVIKDWRGSLDQYEDWSKFKAMYKGLKNPDKLSPSKLDDLYSTGGPNRNAIGELAEAGAEALPEFGGNMNLYGAIAALATGSGALAAGVPGAAVGGGTALGGTFVIANALASPRAQRALLNNPQVRKSVIDILSSTGSKEQKLQSLGKILTPFAAKSGTDGDE